MKNFRLSKRILVRKEGDSVFDIKASLDTGIIWLQWYNDSEDFCIQLEPLVAQEVADALLLSLSILNGEGNGKKEA